MLKNPELRELLVSVGSVSLEGALGSERFTANLHDVPNSVARGVEESIQKLTDFVAKHPDLDKEADLAILTTRYALLYLKEVSEKTRSIVGLNLMKYREYTNDLGRVIEDLKKVAGIVPY